MGEYQGISLRELCESEYKLCEKYCQNEKDKDKCVNNCLYDKC